MSSQLLQRIEQDVKKALKEHDALRLSVLRMLLASAQNKGKEKRAKGGNEELNEEEALGVVRSEAKKRKDAVQEFSKGGRRDLVEKESAELKILETYLPPEMSDDDLKDVVNEVLSHFEQPTAKNFGRIMGEVMKKTGSRASGERVSLMVRTLLDDAH